MNNNWLGYLIRALSSVPVIVAGIEQIHGSAISGAAKKTMAMQALGLAATVGGIEDPVHAQAMSVASGVISNAIDGAVAVMNAANAGTPTTPLTPPAPPVQTQAAQATGNPGPVLIPSATVSAPAPQGPSAAESIF